MTNNCAVCGHAETARSVCVTDDSGACLVDVCAGCLERFDTPRCRLCGDVIDATHRHRAYFDGETEPGDERSVCCSCRNGLLTDRRVIA